jgi:hypothetical protein
MNHVSLKRGIGGEKQISVHFGKNVEENLLKFKEI